MYCYKNSLYMLLSVVLSQFILSILCTSWQVHVVRIVCVADMLCKMVSVIDTGSSECKIIEGSEWPEEHVLEQYTDTCIVPCTRE